MSEPVVKSRQSTVAPSTAEEAQSAHYDRIIVEYDAHYGDPCSQAYRDRFINRPMFEGLDLEGREVLEAMCGSGMTTRALLSRGASVTGLDISELAIGSFQRRWPECNVAQTSLIRSNLPSESFDAVVVVGGLHHLQPHVSEAVEEIHRVLRPGGSFCFFEPHTGSLPDLFRRLWYKLDSRFAPNEAAIDVGALKREFGDRFEFVSETYGGNVAFLFVANSLVLRIPLSWKRFYTPALLRLETLIEGLQGKRLGCFVVGRWKKAGG
jgi:ubiquinone/menaquinone biosynthesis C-methylase UbiE